MNEKLKLAVAGVGNNISALVQGISFYRERFKRESDEDEMPGIKHNWLGGFHVTDVQIVAAFDVAAGKVNKELSEAIFAAPNNYPRLNVDVPKCGVIVSEGLHSQDPAGTANQSVVEVLRKTGAEVLLYSLPSGLQWAADAYARCALESRTGLVNCTPELIANNPDLQAAFDGQNLPLFGDDLASQIGASVVHGALLQLVSERGITLESSHQLNFGGNEDFRNLREHGTSKLKSKLNALSQNGDATKKVTVVPSAGYVPALQDRKVSIINVEGAGWGGTAVSMDIKLKVQDSSNAAGVIIDLVRLAGAAFRAGCGGSATNTKTLFKSPPPKISR